MERSVIPALAIPSRDCVSLRVSFRSTLRFLCRVVNNRYPGGFLFRQDFFCIGIPLCGCLAKPECGLDIIFGDAPTFMIHLAKVGLATGISLFRRLAIPGYGLSIVPGYAKTFCIHPAKVVLSNGIALFRSSTICRQRGRIRGGRNQCTMCRAKRGRWFAGHQKNARREQCSKNNGLHRKHCFQLHRFGDSHQGAPLPCITLLAACGFAATRVSCNKASTRSSGTQRCKSATYPIRACPALRRKAPTGHKKAASGWRPSGTPS